MRLTAPKGRCCGKACQGVNDRFSPNLSLVVNSCRGIVIVATLKKGAFDSFHSSLEFSTSMAGDVRGCTIKSKCASAAWSCLIIVSRKKCGVGLGGMAVRTGCGHGTAENLIA